MMKKLLKNIYALLIGHITVFKHSFKKRVTLEYPEVKPDLPEAFRGKHEWDCQKCVTCKMCERVCPAGAITVNKTEESKNFKVDLKKCIFCGNCMYYCPKGAINLSKEFELATEDKNNLSIEFDGDK